MNTFENRQLVEPLALKAPSCLEKVLGYSGESRWLGLYWEPELNHACYTDGRAIGTSNEKAWQLLCNHPAVKPLLEFSPLGEENRSSRNCLLLDRETRKLYLGEEEVVKSCLEEPKILALLVALDSPETTSKKDQESWFASVNNYTRSIIIGGALLTFLGLPAFGFGAAVILDEKDLLEIELPEWME